MATEEVIKGSKRSTIVSIMGIFVFFVFVWSAWMSVKSIQAAEKNEYKTSVTPGTQSNKNQGMKDKDTISLDELAAELIENLTFDTEMEKMKDVMAESTIIVSEDSELIVYAGKGTYADMLVLVKAKDESSIEQDKQAVERYLADTKKEYEKYIPKEAKKVDDAVIIANGRYLAVCVHSDKQTKEKEKGTTTDELIAEALK